MRPTATALLLLLIPLCAAPSKADDRALDLAIGDPARRDKQAPLVLDGVTDTSAGDVITPQELAARLDDVRLLFVGESHTDIEFHKVQLRVIQELQKRGRQVLVGLEMFPVTEQAALDRWHSDKGLTEDGFVERVALVQELGLPLELLPRHLPVRAGQRHPHVRRQRAARRGPDRAHEGAGGPHARAEGDAARAHRPRERGAPEAVPGVLRLGGRAARQHARPDVPGHVPRPVHLGRRDGLERAAGAAQARRGEGDHGGADRRGPRCLRARRRAADEAVVRRPHGLGRAGADRRRRSPRAADEAASVLRQLRLGPAALDRSTLPDAGPVDARAEAG